MYNIRCKWQKIYIKLIWKQLFSFPLYSYRWWQTIAPLSQNDCLTFLLTTPQGNVETREPEMKRDSRSWTQTIRKTSKTLGKTIGKVLLITMITSVNEQTREWRVSLFEHVFWMISSLYICLELNFNNKQVFLYVKVQLVKTEIGVSTWFVFLRFYIFLETISPMISPLQFLPRHHTGGNSPNVGTLAGSWYYGTIFLIHHHDPPHNHHHHVW